MSVGQDVLQLRKFEAMAREVRDVQAHHDATHATGHSARCAAIFVASVLLPGL